MAEPSSPHAAAETTLLVGTAAAVASGVHRDSSVRYPPGTDGASVLSGSDAGPFSGADAAIVADAFRQALRKPDFAGRPVEEGESPENREEEELISRELAEEGRDIRSVSSARDVRVHGSSSGEGH